MALRCEGAGALPARAPLPLALVLVHCLAMRAAGLVTYSPYLTNDTRFPARAGVYRADTELLSDAPCSSANPCCRKGSELVIETRYDGTGKAYRAATCQQCLPGWFADRRMRLEFDASKDAFSRDWPTCTRCPHGKHGTAHRKNCSSCLSDEHTDQHTRLARRDCLGCATGEYYAWKEGCFGCWPNYFCPNGHNLTLCPNGTKSEARQTQCVKIPRVTFDTVPNPPPSAATPCTSQQHRADLGCRQHTINRYTCEASTSNIKVVLTSASDDHHSKTSELQIGCLWCPAFNDSGVVADRCLARTFCKAAEGLSSCWDGISAAPSARRASPAALALALAMTLGSAGRLTWQGQQRW